MEERDEWRVEKGVILRSVEKKYVNILVTGGRGLVGSALSAIASEYLGREFHFIGSKDCDLTKAERVREVVESLKPDAIVHLAAVCGGIGLSIKYPAMVLRDNVLMDINILDASRACGVRKTVMSLSTGMYPAEVANPIREEYIHEGSPHPSNYSYSFAKRLVDPLIRAYRAENGMNVIGLIPNGIFGENNNYREDYSTMLSALIRRFYENRNGNGDIVIWGDGTPLREMTYAKDMARAYMWCLDNYDGEQILHVGTTEEHSVGDIAYMIADHMGIDRRRVKFDITKPVGQFRKSTDNSKFMNLSNFSYTKFETALKSTIDWFCSHYGDGQSLRL